MFYIVVSQENCFSGNEDPRSPTHSYETHACIFPQSLEQSGDLSDAELLGVADAIQRDGKLKELADALEVVPLLESIEGEANAPLILIQRWRAGADMHGLEAHSLLVHHLRCIGLTRTADR